MMPNHAHGTAEAAWDEDGATPAPAVLTGPFHAHGHPLRVTPPHPPSPVLVSSYRKPRATA